MADIRRVVKAYDVRGVVPDELDPALVRAIGRAFREIAGSGTVVVGHDMRASSPELVAAFSAGVTAGGADVVDIGLASTDELYFASGSLDLPAAMFTASHNPARYNGIKLCRAGAVPVGQDTGLGEIVELVEAGDLPGSDHPGSVEHRDLLADYAAFLHSLVDLSGIRPLTVVVDAANGMAGHTVPAVLGGTPVSVVPLWFELDGSFPHHEANPIDPANLVDLQRAVCEHGADAGLAFDGDADRCFVVDEHGRAVRPGALTALVAVRELAGEPGATILHNLITGRAVPEAVVAHGGTPVRTRVGHSFIKARMAETGAVFGGEHSGHFYFRDFWRADSGMLAALHVLAALGSQDRPLSELLAPYDTYAASGELNNPVVDAAAVLARVERVFGARDDVSFDHLDGLTVEHTDWSVNLRMSNTEPLLRLNVEAVDGATMAAVRDEVLDLVRSGPG